MKKEDAIALAGPVAAHAANAAFKKSEATPTFSGSRADVDEEDVFASRRLPRPDVLAEVSWPAGSRTLSVRLIRTVRSTAIVAIVGDLEAAPRWALDAIISALQARSR